MAKKPRASEKGVQPGKDDRESVWRQYFSFERGYVLLDPEVRKAFPTDKAVNNALRMLVDIARRLAERGDIRVKK